MPNAILKFDGREIELGEDLTTIGRAADNTVSFAGDSNISRYHAEIENRGSGFYLIELGSSNGTTVNGSRVVSEILLKSGDIITFGNSAMVEFVLDEQPEEKQEETSSANDSDAIVMNQTETGNETGEETSGNSKFPTGLAVAGASVGLAFVFVVGAVLFSFTPSSSGCQASAKIKNVENFDTLRQATEVEIELDDETECVSRALFVVDDKILAVADEKPFSAKLDPNALPTLADGSYKSLRVILEDADGKRIQQSDEVLLVFETRKIETPTPVVQETQEEPSKSPTPKPTPLQKGKVSPQEAQAMIENLIKSMGGSGHKINKEFAEKVAAKTNDFVNSGGFSARAQTVQDLIKTTFAQDSGVASSIGFLTAMSRTQFNAASGAEVGFWRMSNDFAAKQNLTFVCGDANLSDTNCSAKVAALYTKNLLRTVFDNDPVYTVAAFGMTFDEALDWKNRLSGDRADFWNAIKTPAQRDELIKFFAAGIVAENPQRFGLKDDRPLPTLY